MPPKIINAVVGNKKPTGTYTATGATSNYDAYANNKRYITIGQGSASNPTDTTARDSTDTSLSGTALTVQATVTPTVTAGWVDSGVAGTIKIKGTVPTQTKAAEGAGTVNPDSGKLLSSVTVASGSVSVADATKASTSTSLDGTTLTVQASVSPTVSAGWVDSGTAGTIKITGTVPTETKSVTGAGDVTPSTGKLLSKVTVDAGSAAVTSATYSSIVPTISGTSYTASVSVTPTVTAGWVDNGTSGTITITGTVPTQTKSAAGAGTVNPDSGKLLSSVSVSAGSAVVTPKTVSASTLTGVWSSANDRYEVSQESQTISVSGSCTPGWVDTVSSGNVTVNAPAKHIIDRAGITQTSAASYTSSGTLTSGQYINIAPGYNPVGTTWQAPSGGGTISGNATPSQVLSGSTFMSSATTSLQTGSMVNMGSWSYGVDPWQSEVTIPEGYHNGFGKIVNSYSVVSPVIDTSGHTPDDILQAGTQIYIPTGFYYRDYTYTVPSSGGTITDAYIDIEDNWSAGFGRYVRDPSNDLDNRYAWTINTGETPIYSDYTLKTYYTVWTTSETPSTGDYLWNRENNTWNYVDYSMSSVQVGEYHPAQGGSWTAWTELPHTAMYVYISWYGTLESNHRCDAFYVSTTDASHCGSLYYGGLAASNSTSIESVSWTDTDHAPVTGDYSLKSFIAVNNAYRGYWHSIGINYSTNRLDNYTQSNPLTFTIIGHMDPTDYIRVGTVFAPQTTDAGVQSALEDMIYFNTACNAVVVQMYGSSGNKVTYRYKMLNA